MTSHTAMVEQSMKRQENALKTLDKALEIELFFPKSNRKLDRRLLVSDTRY